MKKTGTTIPKFFANKSIFLTGATGFCGKAILEKLLRGCPEITKVFVLVRSKNNNSGEDRITKVLQTELFAKVREENPKSLEKVVPINGDVANDELGLSEEDAAMLREEVSVVIHSAANVNFAASLHSALKSNVAGTKNMLDWAKQLKYLKAFVYISTAYSNSDRLDVDEKVYPNQMSPHTALQLCSLLPAEILNSISPQLRRDNLMSYTVSKHRAEILVDESRSDIPVCIVRPAVVSAAYKEPIPGWIDNLMGFNGILAAVSKGLIHTVQLNTAGVLHIVPVDHVVNLTLAAAMATGEGLNKSENIQVYNCYSSENPFICENIFRVLLKASSQTPFNVMYWYPFRVNSRNPHMVAILHFIFHYVPCVLIDGVLTLIGSKPKYGMVAKYNRLKKLFQAVEVALAMDYTHSTTNTKALFKQLAPVDQESFDFDISVLNHEKFVMQAIYGLRRYAVLDDDRDLPKARRQFKRFKILHHVLLVLLMVLTALLFKLLFF